jgi:DNA transformation protein and related proteins
LEKVENAKEKLTDLPNISKVLSGVLADAGIDTPEQLRNLGSREAFLKIKLRDPTACLCKLCALEGAIRGIRWHDLDPAVKEELRTYFKSL